VFRYITFRSAYAMVTALAICFIFGPRLIRWLRSVQIGQRIRAEVPSGHRAKEGTPTMGGILIIAAILVPTLLWSNLANPYVQLAVVVTVWTGLIGFFDDYLRVVKKTARPVRLRGGARRLPVRASARARGGDPERGPVPQGPLHRVGGSLHPLRDLHLDGLAAGAAAFSFFAFAALAYLSGHRNFASYLNIPYLPGCGELTGYSMSDNTHPAQIFMGDTGSLALGGALGTVAILLKKELLLVIIGGIFVAEALSVILQVGSFKLTGKRIFNMAPFHHHFELMGWSEEKVVVRFWIIAALLALLSISTLKLQ